MRAARVEESAYRAELRAEGDHMIGDDIAEEGIKYLQTVNFGTKRSGSALLAAAE